MNQTVYRPRCPLRGSGGMVTRSVAMCVPRVPRPHLRWDRATRAAAAARLVPWRSIEVGSKITSRLRDVVERGQVALGCDSSRMTAHDTTTTLRRADPAADSLPAGVVRLRQQSNNWHARDGWDRSLLDPASPDWFRLEEEPRAERIKTGHGRSTWRVQVADKIVFAKIFDAGGLADSLRRVLSGGPARKEWRASLGAEVRGVSVPRPLAVGWRRGRFGRTVFLSEGLSAALNLAEAWERHVAGAPPRTRRAAANTLIEEVARIFAAAHERGFVHGDSHPRNILVRDAPPGHWQVAFVDVSTARLTGSPASVPQTMSALAQLDQYFHRCATRAERLRFWRCYMAQRPSLTRRGPGPRAERDRLAALQRATTSNAARLARTRDRRLNRNGKYFSTLSLSGRWRATVTLELERRHVFPEREISDRDDSTWRAILEALVTTEVAKRLGTRGTPTGPGRSGCVVEETFDYDGFHVEMARVRGLIGRLSATLRGSVHRRAFTRSHRLRHRDVPADLILACAEHRSGGLVDATLLVRPYR